MPLVVAEREAAEVPKSGTEAGRRPLGRVGLGFLCVVLALLVAVLIVPSLRPVKLRVAGHMILVGTTTFPANAGAAVPSQGLSAYAFSAGGQTRDQEHVQYVTQGQIHVCALRVRDWVYYLIWFRGRRR